MSTLPTSRAFLTSIINTLTSPLSPPTNPNPPTNISYDASSNPLKALPPSHRALLTTLHVLFPPPMLLQALDLLDRGLVTRLIQSEISVPVSVPVSVPIPISETEVEVWPPQAHIHLPTSASHPEPETGKDDEREKEKGRENVMYSVRSSQPTKGRYASTVGGMIYTVHLESWNCSCAAFAFSAFPASGFGFGSESGGVAWDLSRDEDEDVEIGVGRGEEEGEREWEFGGLSVDGKMDSGGVPVCKHLLACLFGERWKDVLGRYVKEKKVSREEMAGYGAE